jgi:hypoxanthine phosphoribosyltransferase
MADAPVPGARLVASALTVREAWEALAAGLQPHVDAGPCLLLGVLLGGMVPLVNIAGRLKGDFLIDYCHLTRYRGGTSGGAVHWIQRPRHDLRGLTVVLVDDVLDEGVTLAELRRYCEDAGARRVLVTVLVRKRQARGPAAPTPDLVGIEAGDEYLFGCGMDLHERWRHLDAIYAIGGPARVAAAGRLPEPASSLTGKPGL